MIPSSFLARSTHLSKSTKNQDEPPQIPQTSTHPNSTLKSLIYRFQLKNELKRHKLIIFNHETSCLVIFVETVFVIKLITHSCDYICFV